MTAKTAGTPLPKARTPKRGAAANGRRSPTRVVDDADLAPRSSPLGIIKGMRLTEEEAQAEGLQVLQVPPSRLIPHPFNDPTRSQVRPDDPGWKDLLESVAVSGVRITGAAVTKEAFIRRWPDLLAGDVDGDYVLVYGHRRRAAALHTGAATMPIILDDTELDDPSGGLRTMFEENQRRQPLTPLAEAELLARFIDDAKMTQRELASMLGMSQTTVHRRMSLLSLDSSLRALVADGKWSPTQAARVGSELPYGPIRSWQEPDQDQGSEARRAEQLRAYELTQSPTKMIAEAAVDRVVAERESRATAAAKGIEIVDPAARFGDAATARRHRIYDDADAVGIEVVGAIDETGTLMLYRTALPDAADPGSSGPNDGSGVDSDGGQWPDDDERSGSGPAAKSTAAPKPVPSRKKSSAVDRAAVQKARRAAAATIALTPPPRTQLLQVLADQYALGVHAHSAGTAAEKLAAAWGLDGADLSVAKTRVEMAWTLALAAYETRASADGAWSRAHKLYYEILRERAGYKPGPWESEQLDTIAADSW